MALDGTMLSSSLHFVHTFILLGANAMTSILKGSALILSLTCGSVSDTYRGFCAKEPLFFKVFIVGSSMISEWFLAG